MKPKYVTPTATVAQCRPETIVCGSFDNRCDESCRIWHICQDRIYGKACHSKPRDTGLW